MRLSGRGRDLLTPASGDPRPIALHEMTMEVEDQKITSFDVRPHREAIGALIGANSSRQFRALVDNVLPHDKEAGTPLYFMLDDVAIVSRIGGMAWSQHRLPVVSQEAEDSKQLNAVRDRIRRGPTLCSGLRTGGYNDISFDEGIAWPHYFRIAGDLDYPGDPWAWHELDVPPQVCFRRRRRIDVWPNPSSDSIEVDAHYRDSVWGDKHTELSLHEYSLQVSIDRGSHALLSLTVTPRVLPFPECPSAAEHATNLVGMNVEDFRTTVVDRLRGLECCTHLNDMLRGLAEVPALVRML